MDTELIKLDKTSAPGNHGDIENIANGGMYNNAFTYKQKTVYNENKIESVVYDPIS